MSVKIVTKSQTFYQASTFEVEVGTTGLKGGDTGHGGRTYLRFKDAGGTDMNVVARKGEVTLTFGGDAELLNLIDALRFAVSVLKESKHNGTSEAVPEIGSRTLE